MNARYRRVPSSEQEADGSIQMSGGQTMASGGIPAPVAGSPVQSEEKKKRAERIDRLSAKLHAIAWMLGAALVLYATDIFNSALHDSSVNRFALRLSIVCMFASFGIMLYLTLYLPLIKKITVPWEIYCPNMIPASTAFAVSSLILFMIAFWPLYGMLTPIIVFILFMGLLFSTHFISWPC